jgi:hypothetical protein
MERQLVLGVGPPALLAGGVGTRHGVLARVATLALAARHLVLLSVGHQRDVLEQLHAQAATTSTATLS